MLPYAVSPIDLHPPAPLRCKANRFSVSLRLPFSVHTSKFRMLQPLFFLTLTDTPGVGVQASQTLPKKELVMTSKSATSTITLVANHHPHCQHRTAGGRRCRLAVAPNSNSHCYRHLPSPQSTHIQTADLAPNVTDTADHFAYLSQQYEHFQTAQGINQALANLYELLSRNRISPRRASILAYISSLLLRTLPQIDADNVAGIEFNPKT